MYVASSITVKFYRNSAFDPKKLAVQVSRTFARFDRLPFEERRTVLRDVIGHVTVLNGTIPSFTLNGAFLNRVNISLPSSGQSGRTAGCRL
jgi:hypothetical protein